MILEISSRSSCVLTSEYVLSTNRHRKSSKSSDGPHRIHSRFASFELAKFPPTRKKTSVEHQEAPPCDLGWLEELVGRGP